MFAESERFSNRLGDTAAVLKRVAVRQVLPGVFYLGSAISAVYSGLQSHETLYTYADCLGIERQIFQEKIALYRIGDQNPDFVAISRMLEEDLKHSSKLKSAYWKSSLLASGEAVLSWILFGAAQLSLQRSRPRTT